MQTDAAEEQRPTGVVRLIATKVGRLLVSLVVAVVTLIALWRVFIFLRDASVPQWVTAIVAIVWGVGGAGALFLVANLVVEQLPVRWERRVIPFVFVGPALVVLGWYLLLPVLRSFYISLFDGTSEDFVGLSNYVYAFTSPAMRESFRNNLIWLVVGTGFSVGLGLLIAALADRTDPRFGHFDGWGFRDLEIRVRIRTGGRKPNRRGERRCYRSGWATSGLAHSETMEHAVLDRHCHLAADRICDGDPIGRAQGDSVRTLGGGSD
jgi:hypothetical protein